MTVQARASDMYFPWDFPWKPYWQV